MNPREKMLAACLVSVLVLGGLGMTVWWGFVTPWRTLQREIGLAQKRDQDVRKRIDAARLAEERWGALKPLSHNAHLAEQRFREDISQLLQEHELSEDCTIRALPQRKLKNGFTEVRLSVQARGTLRQVVNFLCDFYRREYLSRLDQIGLTAEEQGRRAVNLVAARTRGAGRPSRRPEAGPPPVGPDGPRLNVSLTATALVPMEIKDVEQRPIIDPQPAEGSRGRLPRERTEYEGILTRNLFREWQAAQPIVEPGPRESGEMPIVPGPERPPPVQRPNKMLTATMSTEGKLAAYVRDKSQLELPLEIVELNAPVDDGRLVLVLPRGMVVQVPGKGGEPQEYKYYLYPLGATFAERVELDPARHADIQLELEAALRP